MSGVAVAVIQKEKYFSRYVDKTLAFKKKSSNFPLNV